MSRPTIKTSLIAIFSVMALTVMGLVGYSIVTMSGLARDTKLIGETWMPKALLAAKIEQSVDLLRLAYAKELMADPAEFASEAKATAAVKDGLAKYLSAYEAGIVTENGRRLFGQIRAELDAYLAMGKSMIEMREAGKTEEAKDFFRTEMKAQALTVLGTVEKLVEEIRANAESFVTHSEEGYDISIAVMIAVSALALSIAVGAGIFALMGISRPINTITASMTALAAGDTDSTIPYSGRSDEIGAMAGAVEIFRQTALAKIDADRRMEAARTERERDRLQAEKADHERAAAMAQATNGLANGLTALAAGDLAFQIEERFTPDFEDLRQNFNVAVRQLSQTLAAVSLAADSIDGGSREIANSADDLSKRTERQAAALEETAAALDQITANVTSSSRRAEEARGAASQANADAARSGEVVAEAVLAMSRIEAASGNISNIIGVIDEIAFQTNLLALNAGVEAARAGDAGKGFAVVAQEVRELAQRSATAAKEIKALIQSSTQEVSHGVKLVSETGSALSMIRDSIGAINQHMDAIATSAREQSMGLSEVNTAVNQMDQTTQQNAAMVEEASAASATLAAESAKMRGLINQFHLGRTENHAPATARPAPAKIASSGNAALARDWAEF